MINDLKIWLQKSIESMKKAKNVPLAAKIGIQAYTDVLNKIEELEKKERKDYVPLTLGEPRAITMEVDEDKYEE